MISLESGAKKNAVIRFTKVSERALWNGGTGSGEKVKSLGSDDGDVVLDSSVIRPSAS